MHRNDLPSLAAGNLAVVVGGARHHRRHHHHHHHATTVHHSAQTHVAPPSVVAAPQAPAPRSETEVGNMCRDGWKALGGMAGGLITSESFGWGALPGAIAGGYIGRQICPD
jgi:hypothetical protein